PEGRMVVAWDDFALQVRAVTFNANAVPFGPPLIVCAFATSRWCGRPEVAMSLDGDFIVTWEQSDDMRTTYNIRGRRFNLMGQQTFYPLPLEAINFPTTGLHLNPDVGAHPVLGNHLVVFQDDSDLNGKYEVVVRGISFSPNQPSFSERTVNTVSSGQ